MKKIKRQFLHRSHRLSHPNLTLLAHQLAQSHRAHQPQLHRLPHNHPLVGLHQSRPRPALAARHQLCQLIKRHRNHQCRRSATHTLCASSTRILLYSSSASSSTSTRTSSLIRESFPRLHQSRSHSLPKSHLVVAVNSLTLRSLLLAQLQLLEGNRHLRSNRLLHQLHHTHHLPKRHQVDRLQVVLQQAVNLQVDRQQVKSLLVAHPKVVLQQLESLPVDLLHLADRLLNLTRNHHLHQLQSHPQEEHLHQATSPSLQLLQAHHPNLSLSHPKSRKRRKRKIHLRSAKISSQTKKYSNSACNTMVCHL